MWDFPDPARAPRGQDLLCIGGDLEPETLIDAYRRGIFPMPLDHENGEPLLGWWSPDPRGVLLPDRLRVTRSLRASSRRLSTSLDTDFGAVVAACADPLRPHGWITPAIQHAYRQLHELGVAHSVEVRDGAGALVGGLYGVEVGGLFAGESMFYRERDASKVALVALVEALRADGGDGAGRLIDVQWATPHLVSLGATAVRRTDYCRALPGVLSLPPVLSPEPAN